MASQNGIIMVFWHERVMAMPWLWPSAYALHALQSPHPDGRMMSHAIGCFGVKTVWGSSNRNPLSGLRGLKRILDLGDSVAITLMGHAARPANQRLGLLRLPKWPENRLCQCAGQLTVTGAPPVGIG